MLELIASIETSDMISIYLIVSTIVHIVSIFALLKLHSLSKENDEKTRIIKHLKIQINQLEIEKQQIQIKLDRTESKNLFILDGEKAKPLK